MAKGNVAVITRLLARLGIIIFAGLLLAGCPSKEGSEAVNDPDIFFPDPLPNGEPVYTEVIEPFYASGDEDGEALLKSYDPDTALGSANPVDVFASNAGITVALNLVDDDTLNSEVSVLVADDTVYSIDHSNNRLRKLHHFINRVCEVLPFERLATVESNNGNVVEHSIVHANWVYVVTADGDGSSAECSDLDSIKRYYRLALNYRFNADDTEVCDNETGGESDDYSSCYTRKLPVVLESEARAKLVIGWVDDDETVALNDQKLAYAYLGYGVVEQALRFFDSELNELWRQERVLEQFSPVAIGRGEFSPPYLAEVTELENYAYLIQLGRDVFVMSLNEAMFSAGFAGTDTFLSDRILQLEEAFSFSGVTPIVEPVEFYYDSDELILLNGAKIYRYDYSAEAITPSTSRSFTLKSERDSPLADRGYFNTTPFSQYDLSSCDSATNTADCRAAHDPRTADWQFITDCTAEFNCSFELPYGEDCDTDAERDLDPSLDNPCSAGNYLHISEMNDPSNDAEFRGFMQYAPDYMRSAGFLLSNNRLYITARMNEKDLLLRYNYNAALSDPKPDREQVIFGERLAHYGIEPFVDSGNLFVNTLLYSSTLSNECYKGYQQVECDLGETEENGGTRTCTQKDLDEGFCTLEYREFESSALFCPATDVDSGACDDNALLPVNTLGVESATEDAKWLVVRDIRAESNEQLAMHVLISDQANTVGEGVLYSPSVFAVDESNGSLLGSLGSLNGSVESVAGGWIRDDQLGRLNLISDEVIQVGGQATNNSQSVLDIYFLANPGSGGSVANQVAQSVFSRPITQ